MNTKCGIGSRNIRVNSYFPYIKMDFTIQMKMHRDVCVCTYVCVCMCVYIYIP